MIFTFDDAYIYAISPIIFGSFVAFVLACLDLVLPRHGILDRIL